MGRTVLYDSLSERFESEETPPWYSEAVSYLRGDADRGTFGLYLYHLLRSRDDIDVVINIGTARGHSAVCAARGIKAAGRQGTVHTIDVIDPDENRDWHGSKPETDPLAGERTSMRELVGRFHGPDDESVPIEFHVGDSSTVLADLAVSPDLVFHDGRHTYNQVRSDVDIANGLSDNPPIHVFDDSYLFDAEWTYRPCASAFWHDLAEVPKLGSVIRSFRSLSVSKIPFPGVTIAVQETLDDGEWASIEVVRDPDHAPITAIFPE